MTNLIEPSTPTTEPSEKEYLSKYGFMRKNYLKDHQRITYNQLLLSGKLQAHCLEVQRISDNRLEFMMKQMIERNPPPDKATDGLAWAAHMNMLKHSVEEIILHELIYE